MTLTSSQTLSVLTWNLTAFHQNILHIEQVNKNLMVPQLFLEVHMYLIVYVSYCHWPFLVKAPCKAIKSDQVDINKRWIVEQSRQLRNFRIMLSNQKVESIFDNWKKSKKKQHPRKKSAEYSIKLSDCSIRVFQCCPFVEIVLQIVLLLHATQAVGT